MELAYYLFAHHHILPGDFYRRSAAEKDLIWALASHESDKMREFSYSKRGKKPQKGG